MRFFFDNNLPPKLAKSLHVLVEPHHQVVHLKAKFAADAKDETWMLELAKEEDWVIVSGDLRIRKKPSRNRGLEIGWTHDLLLKARLDQSSVLDSNVEICEMFSGHSSNCRTSEERQRVLCVGYREGREVARATSSNQRRFETRSLPALSRSYPRHFTFHVAHPIRSIRQTEPARLGLSRHSLATAEALRSF